MPDGEGKLIAHRTDHDAFSGSINQDMFEYITYSRMAIADISGGNANAMYELGARHALQDAGTVILRQKGHGIPFDIQTIKAFEYDYLSDAAITASREAITGILTKSLEKNRLDSPIRQALGYVFSQKAAPGALPAGGESPAVPPAPSAPGAPGAPGGPTFDIEALLRKAGDAMKHKNWPVCADDLSGHPDDEPKQYDRANEAGSGVGR